MLAAVYKNIIQQLSSWMRGEKGNKEVDFCEHFFFSHRGNDDNDDDDDDKKIVGDEQEKFIKW